MGSSSDTTSTTSQTQTASPPDWSADLYKLLGSDAMSLYQSGQGGNVWTDPTVAKMSGKTSSGIDALYDAGDWGGYGNILKSLGQYGRRAGDNQYIGDLTGVADYLTPIASGEYLKEGNPYYRDRLAREVTDATDLIKGQLSTQGRYGSDFGADVISENANNMFMQGLENDYNREAQRQMEAISGLGSIYGNAASLYDQGINTAAGIQGMRAGLKDSDFQNALTGAKSQLAAGSLIDDYRQRLLNDQINQFYALDNRNWNRLGMALNAAAGASGPYGTMTGTGTQTSSTNTSNPMAALGAVGSIIGK